MILVTGGAGYIGSHVSVELLSTGQKIVILDNFSNSKREVIDRIQKISREQIPLVEGDIRDQRLLERVLNSFKIVSVVHFAGLKSVSDSICSPMEYYDNNVIGSHRLLSAMQATGVKKVVFSSSATVYGPPAFLPYAEDHPLRAINPYGRTKLVVEEMLRDLYASDPAWRIGILRYFNPAGAHDSGLIGEDPSGIPNNLVPYIAQVAVGKRPYLNVWGNDYDTPDGTGIRDYIHVVDLAVGHLSALRLLDRKPICFAVNLGTGAGSSVLEVLRAFEIASGNAIPYVVGSRRAGDVATSYAAVENARTLLGWTAKRDLLQMCADH
jgi:UDP-glucose 4-epimerase